MVGAALLGAAPCADLPALDRALDVAAKQPKTGSAEGALLQDRFAPIPVDAPEGDDPAAQLAFIRARLHALCALATAPTPRLVAPDPKRLTAILDRPELAQARSKNRELLQHWVELIWSWLSDLLESRGAGRFAEGTRALVLGLAAALIAVGAWRVLRMKRGKPAAKRSSPSHGSLRLDPPEDHLRRARAALEAEPREAIREGLLALLSVLERRRLARPDRVKTNGEMVAELPLRGAPVELIARISPLVTWYDRTFYSLAPVGVAEATAFVDSIAALRPGIEAGA